MTSYWFVIVNKLSIALSYILFSSYLTSNNVVTFRGHSRSLEQHHLIAHIVLHCNFGPILYHFWDIHRRILAWPWNLG